MAAGETVEARLEVASERVAVASGKDVMERAAIVPKVRRPAKETRRVAKPRQNEAPTAIWSMPSQ